MWGQDVPRREPKAEVFQVCLEIGRDVNAARNILAEGVLRFGTNGPPSEAQGIMHERAAVAPILTVDGGKMTQEVSA
jgi:hypothetical protein